MGIQTQTSQKALERPIPRADGLQTNTWEMQRSLLLWAQQIGSVGQDTEGSIQSREAVVRTKGIIGWDWIRIQYQGQDVQKEMDGSISRVGILQRSAWTLQWTIPCQKQRAVGSMGQCSEEANQRWNNIRGTKGIVGS
jgi:hypothetical protein